MIDWNEERSIASNTRKPSKVAQWEVLLQKFNKEKATCSSGFMEMPRIRRATKTFPTGSKYNGSWNVLGMSGTGRYVYPNGVIYEGEFNDGVFHGKGQMIYPNGVRLVGQFNNGEMVERKVIFADDVVYSDTDWSYCKGDDRRFSCEFKKLEPAGRSVMTPKMPSRQVPPDFYDNEEGFFDPITKFVYSPNEEKTMMRCPGVEEQKWIKRNCRCGTMTPLGPRKDLYESWTEPVTTPEAPPPPPATSQMEHESATDWDREATFDEEVLLPPCHLLVSLEESFDELRTPSQLFIDRFS